MLTEPYHLGNLHVPCFQITAVQRGIKNVIDSFICIPEAVLIEDETSGYFWDLFSGGFLNFHLNQAQLALCSYLPMQTILPSWQKVGYPENIFYKNICWLWTVKRNSGLCFCYSIRQSFSVVEQFIIIKFLLFIEKDGLFYLFCAFLCCFFISFFLFSLFLSAS